MKPLKKWQKFAAASLAAIIMLGTTFTSSVAWFETKNDTHLDAGKGRTATAFFYSGDGETPETAYEINLPIHLYNLAWLQYMGKFNVVDDGNVTKTYFKITADLDMTGWVLPPIGTAKYPFVGELVGNGCEVSNLQVDNRLSSETDAGTIVQKPSSITKLASNSEFGELNIVGVFGVVGTDSAVGSYSYSNAAPSVSDLYLNNCTVTSHAATTLGGIAAGYVAGSYMEDVGVASSTLTFAKNNAAKLSSSITNNLSDYTTIGFTKDKASIQHTETSVVVPTSNSAHGVNNGGGQEKGWGGSIDFKSMFNRLTTLRGRATAYNRGVYSEDQVRTIERTYIGGVSHDESTDNSTTTNYTTTYLRTYDSRYNNYNELEGEIAFRYRNNASFMYLTGGNNQYDEFPKSLTIQDTVSFYEETYSIAGKTPSTETREEPVPHDAYTISIYGYGMNNNNGTIVATNGSATTSWVCLTANDEIVSPTSTTAYYLVTYYNNGFHYLTGTRNNSVSLTTNKANAVTFTYDGTRPSTVVGNRTLYLYQSGNNIILSSNTDTFSYAQGTPVIWNEEVEVLVGSFLSATTTSVLSVQAESDATRWVLSEREGQVGALYTNINGRDYYLNATRTTLSMSTTPTTLWSKSNNNVLSTIINGNTYYLAYSDSNGYYITNTAGTPMIWSAKTEAQKTTKTLTGYYLYYTRYGTNYYLTATPSGLGYSTNSGTPFFFSEGKGNASTIFFREGDTSYYLRVVSTTALGVTTTASEATVWSSTSGSGNISTTYQNRTYYLYYNRNNYVWQPSTNTQTINSSSAGSSTIATPKIETSTTGPTSTNNGVKLPETFFPLTVNDNNYQAADKNSGYIVSGSNSEKAAMIAQTDAAAEGAVGGDIRVSEYAATSISNSMSGNTFQSSSLAVVGRSYRSNGFVHITDNVFDSGSNGTNTLRNSVSTTMSYTNMGLEKYADSRSITSTESGLQSIFGGSSNVYGIHFMNATIGMDNLCVAPKARIDAVTYDNYQLPRDSVDFHLRESGFINFFGASMYSGNNSFFSLHEIVRNEETHAITQIKEISKVYGVPNNTTKKIDHSYPYIYQYAGENAPSMPNNYQQIFDMTWVTNPSTFVQSAVYYYEVPVNAGEYALGSTSGTGAYLIYLDLAANAMEYDYTNFYEYSKTIITEFEYPNGVTLVSAKGDDLDPKNSIALAMPSADTVKLSRTDDDAFAKFAKSDESVVYVGYGLTMYIGNTDPPGTKVELTDLDPVSQKTIEIKRLTTVSYNSTLKRTEVTEVTATIVDNGNAEYTGRLSNDGGVNWETMGDVDSTLITTTWADEENIPTGQDNMITFTALSVPVHQNGELVDVTVNLLITYERDEEETENFFQVATGYTITVVNPSTTDPLDVVVSEVYKDGDTFVYTITINGTTVTGTIPQTIPVAAAS